jgi:hypothetical protein
VKLVVFRVMRCDAAGKTFEKRPISCNRPSLQCVGLGGDLPILIMVVVYMFFFHLAYDDKHVCYNMVSCTELMSFNL